MYGAIIGDICGSIYEWNNRKTDKPEEIELINHDCHFTDDTVLTCAVAEAVMSNCSYKKSIYEWANKYPNAGYGCHFSNWLRNKNPQPYNSWGNGSAMRVSAIGWGVSSFQSTFDQAQLSAECTHNHPEGIKGAQAVAAAIYMAHCKHQQAWDEAREIWYSDKHAHDYSKEDIKHFIEKTFGYNLSRTLNEIRPDYKFDESCQKTVPEAIIAFLESHDFVSAIQNAISIGGDSDTVACITGSIAEAYYREIPAELIKFAHEKVTDEMRNLLDNFCHNFSESDRPAFPDYYVQIENEQKLQTEKWKRIREQEELEYQQKKEQEEREYQQQFQLREVIYASVLFYYVTEDVFCQINPLGGVYSQGMYNDMPDNSAFILDNFYSDQSRLQYFYFVHRSNGQLYFSLIVSHFNDTCHEDHRDLNRIRFVDYFKDFKNWENLEVGFIKINFAALPEHISLQELPKNEWEIAHITGHLYGDNIHQI
jgi:ADP-ribosylglycohydrolase